MLVRSETVPERDGGIDSADEKSPKSGPIKIEEIRQIEVSPHLLSTHAYVFRYSTEIYR